MKIIQINSVYKTGSTGRIVEQIHHKLMDNGISSFVAYGRGKHGVSKDLIKIGTVVDQYYHAFKTRFFDQHGLASKSATRDLIEKIKEINPDIIHLHNIHGYYLNYEILFEYLKESKVKVIWTLHDCWAYTGHCSHYSYVNCNKWKKECNSCPQIQSYPKSLGIDRSKDNYYDKQRAFTGLNDLTLVTPSQWLNNELSESFLNIYSKQTIYNGIDLNVFKNRISNFREIFNLENKIMILGVANIWSDRKGLTYFIELDKILNEVYKIVIVGKIDSNVRLPKSIIHIEQTENVEKLAEIYSSADVFLNPTLEDNYPTTNLEALACNTPVITFESGGSGENFPNNFSRILNEKTSKKLKETIEEVVKMHEYNSHSLNDKEILNKDTMVHNYLKLYQTT